MWRSFFSYSYFCCCMSTPGEALLAYDGHLISDR